MLQEWLESATFRAAKRYCKTSLIGHSGESVERLNIESSLSEYLIKRNREVASEVVSAVSEPIGAPSSPPRRLNLEPQFFMIHDPE